ncbi:MAG TPA: hypothetical protein VHE58_00590 [Burkholderiales bacterium]|nr:hypothetical protein [Burkholderiales bacterium]
MKNQYFGDVNDYRKYGLLRLLFENPGSAMKLSVCWMLTSNDSRKDGEFRKYLSDKKHNWCAYDPELFKKLKKSDRPRRGRSVKDAGIHNLLRNATYFSYPLGDSAAKRGEYFKFMQEKFGEQDVNLIFLDPDNGLETDSVGYGGKDSSKYLYWDEVERVAKKRSLIIYQHFRREPRNSFIQKQLANLKVHTNAAETHAFFTSYVVFLVAIHRDHADLKNACKAAAKELSESRHVPGRRVRWILKWVYLD